MISIQIQEEDFDIAHELSTVRSMPNCGAEVLFIGRVRENDYSTALTHLTLEHFPEVTEGEINRIANIAKERWNISYIRVIHRVGGLFPNDNIVLLITASRHRYDAYQANQFIMDYLKTEAPFWKKEFFKDGHSAWVEAKKEDQLIKERWDLE